MSKFWEYGFILPTIFSSEIEWSPHPSEKDRDFFGLYFLDDFPDIGFDIFRWFSLEGVIGSDTEDDERWGHSLEDKIRT